MSEPTRDTKIRMLLCRAQDLGGKGAEFSRLQKELKGLSDRELDERFENVRRIMQLA